MEASIAYRSRPASKSQFGFHTIPNLVELEEWERNRLIEIGPLAISILKKSMAIVANAVKSPRTGMDWLVKIIFGSIPPNQRNLAYDLTCAAEECLPLHFFRADVLGNGQIAELQCPGSGWGYTFALEEHYGIEPSQVIEAIRRFTKGRKASWWLHDLNHEPSVRHLEHACNKNGIDLKVYNAAEFDPDSVELMIKRPPLPELIATEKGQQLLRRWMNGKVELDLLPTMVPETKYLMCLLYHPQTMGYFTDEERQLAPPTYFITSADQILKPKEGYREQSIENIFLHYRKGFIVKYGGAKKELRGGCHAVYNLGAKSMKFAARKTLLKRALADHESGESWILQRFIDTQRKIVWDKQGTERMRYPMFRVEYYVSENGNPSIVQTTATFRSDWKVHARSDARLGLCK
ncbi:hypothetical protein CL632_02415 [bacterium]|jgi:hypothetical protein|nr:hypothetical protein [bacterium]|tara:strand:+ start:4928 stop:6145 length:1218 start_codon:yes stop_codon:yes gene_type:complete